MPRQDSIENENRFIAKTVAAGTMEITPKGAEKIDNFATILPASSRVFITFLPGSDINDTIQTAIRLRKEGMIPIPHLAARSIPNLQFLKTNLARLVKQASVDTCLIIGGGVRDPVGEYHASIEILETGLFQEYGFKHIFVAGHPEGSPDFPDNAHWQALSQKQKFMQHSHITLEITTQFCFAAKPVIQYAKKLQKAGITMKLRVGIPGLATIKTLMAHAVACGVGPSMKVIKHQVTNLSKLLTVREPNKLVRDLCDEMMHNHQTAIDGFHLYPLGGFAKTAIWQKKIADGDFILDKTMGFLLKN
ncbi:MAG: metFprotein [Alphaproteobacteria bacterium]